MLKITITESPTEMRWILQGRRIGTWVSELRANWRMAHRNRKGPTCTVEPNDVTFIDKDGGKLLGAMSREGTQFVASDVYVKHVLDRLGGKSNL